MSIQYRHSNEAAQSDGYRAMVALLAAVLVLLALLGVWLSRARVSLWIRSKSAVVVDESDPTSTRQPVLATLAPSASGRCARVRADDELGAMRSEQGPRVIARFSASEAIGRVRSGQLARIGFAALPPLEYGRFLGHVVTIAKADLGDAISVEIALDGAALSRIHLEEGMRAEVEVETSQVSPATFLFRAIASDLDAPAER